MTIPSRGRALARRLFARTRLGKPPALPSNTYEDAGNQWYALTIGGASTLGQYAVGGEVVRDALGVLERLSADRYHDYVCGFYRAGLQRFGDRWQYADINTALIAIARVLQPRTYLEIGVRRGRSLAMLASQAAACDIVACDLFIEGYAGMDNPGAGFVRSELARIGHAGAIEFLIGDSHEVVPAYFRDRPAAYFDVITVDGDHTALGAAEDLTAVLGRVKIGGVVVFDDLSNPAHPELRRVWDDTFASRSDFSTFAFTEIGFGVGIAVRHA
jgi:predicted O-methyltransferase YrrM